MTTLLVCGSRGWKDPAPIEAIIAGYDVLAEGIGHKLTVVHGGARGADSLAGAIAKRWGARVIVVKADWDRLGKGAGPERNKRMLAEHRPDAVYAFRTYGKSSGTDHMVAIAEAAGIPTFTITGGTHPVD